MKKEKMLIITSSCVSMRHISISLLLAPNPVIDEPTTYRPHAEMKLHAT